jgi:alkanesulfonate monooxygenase SsuD/methylene tetrahydromethanopterin reductase-like flavin-dependent oxidoreductase (luciferase family)
MLMDTRNLGFGIAGAVDRSVIRRVAVAAELAGIATFWLNDTPDGDSLAGLAEAAQVTSSIRLATGVIPLDRQDATVILRRCEELELPEDRLVLGVGSGRATQALSLVSVQVESLKARSGAQVFIGALGPRMRALAADIADGLLLNMLPVRGAQQARAEMRQVASKLGRDAIEIALYVRVSLGSGARERLELEAQRYEQIPSYAANFARLGVRAAETAVIGDTSEKIREGLQTYTGAVDETVVRAITSNDGVDEYLTLIDAITSR